MIPLARQLTAERPPYQTAALLGVLGFVLMLGAANVNFGISADLLNDTYFVDVAETNQRIQHGSFWRPLALLSLGSLGFFWLLTDRRRDVQDPWLGLAIVTLLGWAMASICWTDDTMLTGKRLISLACLATGALAVARALTWRQLLVVAAVASFLLVMLGLAAEVALGTFRPWGFDYRYAGIAHPNITAGDCGMFLLAATALLAVHKRAAGILVPAILLVVALQLLTKSRGGTASILIALGGYWWLTAQRRGRAIGTCWGLALLALAVLCVGDSFTGRSMDIALMGRQADNAATLTGRLPLWAHCWDYIQSRLWLGFGHEAFWNPVRSTAVSTAEGWNVPNSHNGFIDVALTLGIVGFFSVVAALILGIRRALDNYRLTGRPEYAYALAIVLFAVCINMLGSRLFMPYLQTLCLYVVLAKLIYDEPDVHENPHPVPLTQIGTAQLVPR